MSISRLPSGRWRAQVYDSSLGRNVSVSRILGGSGAFATKTEAKRARVKARERLGSIRSRDLTVRGFWERWTTDPLFARPKKSSDIRRRELTKGFVERYGEVPIFQVSDEIVAEWLAGREARGERARAPLDVQRRRLGEGGTAGRAQSLREAGDLARQGSTRSAAAE
jgi:hypothetical protein